MAHSLRCVWWVLERSLRHPPRVLLPRQERQQQAREEGNVLDLQRRKDEERRRIREEKARLARQAAIQVATGLSPPCPGGLGAVLEVGSCSSLLSILVWAACRQSSKRKFFLTHA